MGPCREGEASRGAGPSRGGEASRGGEVCHEVGAGPSREGEASREGDSGLGGRAPAQEGAESSPLQLSPQS